MALNPTKTATNPRIAKLIELEVAGRIRPEHSQELETYRAQGLAPPKAGADLTENQSKSTGFYNRAVGSNTDYEKTGVARQPRSVLGQTAVNVLSPNLTNSFTGDERQKADQAKEDFIRASLRYESGAAIGRDEFVGQDRIFFPQPGDGAAVIAQKEAARRRVIEGLKVSSGEGASALNPAAGATAVVPAADTVNTSQMELVRGDQAPAQSANAVGDFTTEQRAAIAAVARTGDANSLKAVLAGFGRQFTGSDEELTKIAAYYSNPANANAPVNLPETDNTVKAVDPGDGDAGAFVRGAANVGSLGLVNRIGAVVDSISNDTPYSENLDRRRGYDAFDEQNNPYARLGGQFFGGAALPMLGGQATAGALARTGAVYGGATGFNDSYGDVGSRALSGGLGALAGAGLGYGLGRAGAALAGRGGPPAPPGDGARVLAAAGRQGVDVMPADVGGVMTRRFTSAAAQGPLSAGPIIRGGQRANEQMMGARDRIASSVGNAADPFAAGEAAQQGAQRYIQSSRQQVGALYDAARTQTDGVRPVAQRAIDTLDANLAQLAETPSTSAPVTKALESLGADLTSPEGLSIDALRRLRTNVRGQAYTDELRGTDFQRRANQVLDSISDDIAEGLPPQARAAFRAADTAHRERVEMIDQVIKPIIGGRGDKAFPPERVFQNLQNATRSDTGKLRRFMQTLPDDEQASVRATVISQLGRSSAGTQNAEGTAFSAGQFLTNWNQLTPRAKDVLFRGETRDALNDLATIANGTKQAQGYANRSNTGGAVNVAALFGIGSVSPTAAAVGAAGQIITGRLLASPAFARLLARPARTPEQVEAVIRRVTTLASRQPAIANDLLPIREALQSSLPRVAAQNNEQNRR